MTYVDTSALVPLFVPENQSSRMRRWLAALPLGSAAVSDWTVVEFASALGARVRAREMSASVGAEAVSALRALVAESFVRIAFGPDEFGLAADLVEDFDSGLRAGDALHLAIAIRRRARLLTLDRGLRRAAVRAGVELAPTAA